MARLVQSCTSSSKTFLAQQFPYNHLTTKKCNLQTPPWPPRKKFPSISTSRCCSTGSAPSSLIQEKEVQNSKEIKEREFEYLESENGWRVRRLAEDDQEEVQRASLTQAEAFHSPVALFDDLFFLFFQAEVLSGLLYKLRNSPTDRYACLVAEPASTSEASDSYRRVVGVVDVTVLRDGSVLQHAPEAEEYLYVSGLAVSKSLRRRKIASTLLKACDVLCCQWGYKLLALRAYEEDAGARKLYSNAGYRVVSSDPLWTSTWIGRKRRVLMIKDFSVSSNQ